MKHDAEQILTILDDCCNAYTFAYLNNANFFMAATRLSLFRSPEDWAMVIEKFGYSASTGTPSTTIQTYASRLQNRDWHKSYDTPEAHENYIAQNQYNEFRAVYPIAKGSWLDPEDCYLVAEGATELLLRGRLMALPGQDAYEKAGVERASAPRVEITELCCVLADGERDLVLATAEERRVNVPPELQNIMTLAEWAHPDVLEKNERPSGSATFQQLAEVLVGGNTEDYRPGIAPNTHWRHWPDLGI